METIRQTVVMDCPASAFYDAFLDEETHTEITGVPASIDPHVGGEYRAYGDELQGSFTALMPDEKIVMRWRSNVLPDWPQDHFAVIELELWQSSDGTTIEFTASDVPEEYAAAVAEGWETFYWIPFMEYFKW